MYFLDSETISLSSQWRSVEVTGRERYRGNKLHTSKISCLFHFDFVDLPRHIQWAIRQYLNLPFSHNDQWKISSWVIRTCLVGTNIWRNKKFKINCFWEVKLWNKNLWEFWQLNILCIMYLLEKMIYKKFQSDLGSVLLNWFFLLMSEHGVSIVFSKVFMCLPTNISRNWFNNKNDDKWRISSDEFSFDVVYAFFDWYMFSSMNSIDQRLFRLDFSRLLQA